MRYIRQLYLFLALFFSLSSAGRCDDHLNAYLDAHLSTVESLDSVDLVVELYSPRQPSSLSEIAVWASGVARSPVLFYRIHWVRSGAKEYLSSIPFEETEDDAGFPRNYEEIVRREGKEYVLRNWDRQNPRQISPAMQGSTTAEIRLETSEFRSRDPSQLLLLRPRFELSEPRGDLGEFIRRFSLQEIIQDSPAVVVIRLAGDSLGTYSPNEHVEVELSKKFGFLISRLTRHKDNASSEDAKAGNNWSQMEYKVVRFASLGSGVFLPERVDYAITDPGLEKPVMLGKYEANISSVNKKVDDTVFQLEFPENVVVRDSTEQGEVKDFLWGADNTPVKKIESHDELAVMDPEGFELMAKYTAKSKSPPITNGRSNFFSVLIIANVVVFAILAFLFFRKRYYSR